MSPHYTIQCSVCVPVRGTAFAIAATSQRLLHSGCVLGGLTFTTMGSSLLLPSVRRAFRFPEHEYGQLRHPPHPAWLPFLLRYLFCVHALLHRAVRLLCGNFHLLGLFVIESVRYAEISARLNRICCIHPYTCSVLANAAASLVSSTLHYCSK